MRVLYLIVARGGSKGVPGKNLKKIGGISLVGFKAISARNSRYCSRVIISTESEAIQRDAREYGVDVPFTRPLDLASDTASSDAVVVHAMEWIEGNTKEKYDAVMLLEASSPFGRAIDYDEAVSVMEKQDADLVVGMREVEINNIYVGPMGKDGNISAICNQLEKVRDLRRQNFETQFTMNGAFYLLRWDSFLRHRRRYVPGLKNFGLVMEREYSIEIDSPIDLAWAEFLWEKGYVDKKHWKEEAVGAGSRAKAV